jgi:hypothetical protein
LVSDETIAKVEEAMLKDRRVTVRELCEIIPDVSKTCIDHLFPELKKHLGGMHFRTREELKEEVLSYDSGIKKVVHRMQKCIDLNGDYVEK